MQENAPCNADSTAPPLSPNAVPQKSPVGIRNRVSTLNVSGETFNVLLAAGGFREFAFDVSSKTRTGSLCFITATPLCGSVSKFSAGEVTIIAAHRVASAQECRLQQTRWQDKLLSVAHEKFIPDSPDGFRKRWPPHIVLLQSPVAGANPSIHRGKEFLQKLQIAGFAGCKIRENLVTRFG